MITIEYKVTIYYDYSSIKEYKKWDMKVHAIDKAISEYITCPENKRKDIKNTCPIMGPGYIEQIEYSMDEAEKTERNIVDMLKKAGAVRIKLKLRQNPA